MPPSPLDRLRRSRLFQVVLVYLGASWVVLQVTNELHEALRLPDWVSPLTVLLLLVGLVITLATAWVQGQPGLEERAEKEEVPHSWELDVGDAVSSISRGRLPHLTWARTLVGGIVAFSLLFGAAGAYVLLKGGSNPLAPKEASAVEAPDGIAVLPFTVRGEGMSEWREGVVDLLSTGLDGAAGLRAIASRTVMARWNELVHDSMTADESVALEVARRTGARYALLGSAVAIGPRVRLVADVRSVDDGSSLGQVQVEGQPDSVLTLLDRLAAQSLGLVLRGERDLPEVDLSSLTTSSLPALKAYLAGERQFRRGDFDAAAESFSRAVLEDTLFALAYYRLSQSYGWSEGVSSERAHEASRRSMDLAPRLPDREAALAAIGDAVQRAAPDALPRAGDATRRYPDDAEAWYQLGEAYMHLPQSLGGWDDAEPAFQRAVTLAPTFAPYHLHLIDAALRGRADSAAADRQITEYERLAPSSPKATQYRLAFDMAFGSPAARDTAIARALSAFGNDPLQVRQFNGFLDHPRFSESAVRFLKAAVAMAPSSARGDFESVIAARELYDRGHIREGLATLRDPHVPADRRAAELYTLYVLGLIPDSLMATLADRGEIATADPYGAEWRGSYAASRGQWSTEREALARLRQISDSMAVTGDTVSARRIRAGANAVEGYAALLQGRDGEAIRLLEEARRGGDGWAPFHLAHLYERQGRYAEAIRLMGSGFKWFPDPWTQGELGRMYAKAGDIDKARAALQLFVSMWATADASAQPAVEEAKKILVRIGADQGG